MKTTALVASAAALCFASAATAQKPVVYPAKGVSAQQTLNTFCRAYGACMEGRGYTIG